MHKKNMGKFGEAVVISQIYQNDCNVFFEFGDNSKIDLIVEDKKGNLFKIQVKTVNREKQSPDVSKFYTYKSGPNYQFRYDESHVDWFAIVDFQTSKIAWLSSKILQDVGYQFSLRHERVLNNQKSNIHYFDDYIKFPF